jgi:plasmid stability protein
VVLLLQPYEILSTVLDLHRGRLKKFKLHRAGSIAKFCLDLACLTAFPHNAVIICFLEDNIMGVLSVRNLPDEVHRALRARAASHGRSTEAEVRAILEEAVNPPDRIKLGTLLWNIGREVGLTDEEVDLISQRDRSEPRTVDFESGLKI